MSKSILKEKSYHFALKIIAIGRVLQSEKKEFILSKQVIRSGTAVGALVSEAEFAQSKTDFAHKMNIALKEANETDYWLKLISDSGFSDGMENFSIIQSTCNELIAMLVSTVKTSRQNISRNLT